MNYFKIDTVRTKIALAFEDNQRPDLTAIRPLGCCEDHDADFEWYRHHSWQELPAKIADEAFDSVEFSSLHPVAYHYFVPGLLLATLDAIGNNVSWHGFGGKDWMQNLVPSKETTEQFRCDYLSRFSEEQIDAVTSHLKLFQEMLAEKRGYPDDDVTRAINEVWQVR